MQKELEKLKEAVNSSEYRIKWFQNKLKDELENHKVSDPQENWPYLYLFHLYQSICRYLAFIGTGVNQYLCVLHLFNWLGKRVWWSARIGKKKKIGPFFLVCSCVLATEKCKYRAIYITCKKCAKGK